MASSITELARRWKEEDGDPYNNNNNKAQGSNSRSKRKSNVPCRSIETIITELFGSCSVNLQSIFESASPRTGWSDTLQQQTNAGTQSTSPTTKSSTQSPGVHNRMKKGMNIRSKSLDCRTRKKTRELEGQRRYRSMSRVYDQRTSILPDRNIQATEISILDQDDDVSAITARTLNELYNEEMQRIAAQTETGTTNQIENSSTLSSDKEEVFEEVSEEVFEDATHISMKSSGTTEFESIWQSQSNLNSTKNSDNTHFGANRETLKTRGIYRHNKQASLQRINRGGQFSTIEENGSLYGDEQEI